MISGNDGSGPRIHPGDYNHKGRSMATPIGMVTPIGSVGEFELAQED